VDESVQVFGGYGFMEEYPITHAYRDARINRIFEGTNEVNRLVAAGTLLQRTLEGRVNVMAAMPQIQSEVTSGTVSDFATGDTPVALRESVNLVERAKRAALFSIMAAAPKFAANIREEQEFLEAAANQLITLFAADSAVARALDAARDGNADVHTHELLAQIAVLRLLPETRAAIESVLTMGFDGDERRRYIATVRAYLGDAETNIVPLQRELAGIVAARGGFPIK
jgi:acyl-CoA dehydrogenase-like protein